MQRPARRRLDGDPNAAAAAARPQQQFGLLAEMGEAGGLPPMYDQQQAGPRGSQQPASGGMTMFQNPAFMASTEGPLMGQAAPAGRLPPVQQQQQQQQPVTDPFAMQQQQQRVMQPMTAPGPYSQGGQADPFSMLQQQGTNSAPLAPQPGAPPAGGRMPPPPPHQQQPQPGGAAPQPTATSFSAAGQAQPMFAQMMQQPTAPQPLRPLQPLQAQAGMVPPSPPPPTATTTGMAPAPYAGGASPTQPAGGLASWFGGKPAAAAPGADVSGVPRADQGQPLQQQTPAGQLAASMALSPGADGATMQQQQQLGALPLVYDPTTGLVVPGGATAALDAGAGRLARTYVEDRNTGGFVRTDQKRGWGWRRGGAGADGYYDGGDDDDARVGLQATVDSLSDWTTMLGFLAQGLLGGFAVLAVLMSYAVSRDGTAGLLRYYSPLAADCSRIYYTLISVSLISAASRLARDAVYDFQPSSLLLKGADVTQVVVYLIAYVLTVVATPIDDNMTYEYKRQATFYQLPLTQRFERQLTVWQGLNIARLVCLLIGFLVLTYQLSPRVARARRPHEDAFREQRAALIANNRAVAEANMRAGQPGATQLATLRR